MLEIPLPAPNTKFQHCELANVKSWKSLYRQSYMGRRGGKYASSSATLVGIYRFAAELRVGLVKREER